MTHCSSMFITQSYLIAPLAMHIGYQSMHISHQIQAIFPVRPQIHGQNPLSSFRQSFIDLLPVRNDNQLLLHLAKRKRTPLFLHLGIIPRSKHHVLQKVHLTAPPNFHVRLTPFERHLSRLVYIQFTSKARRESCAISSQDLRTLSCSRDLSSSFLFRIIIFSFDLWWLLFFFLFALTGALHWRSTSTNCSTWLRTFGTRFLLYLHHIVLVRRINQHRRQWRELEQIYLAFPPTGHFPIHTSWLCHIKVVRWCYHWMHSRELVSYLAHVFRIAHPLRTFLDSL